MCIRDRVNTVEIQNRNIANLIEIDNNLIDWKRVNVTINKMREESISFLERSVFSLDE